MKIIKKIEDFESKFQNWIHTHKFLWVVSLFFLGLTLGIMGNSLLGGVSRQGIIMGLSYGFILVVTDFVTWGGD